MHPEPFRRPPHPAVPLDPPPRQPSTEETERLRHLRAMLADLTGYIERRAEELATPLIEDAAERAREMVAEAQFETTRQEALVAELRCRLAAADRHQDETDGYLDRLAVALGHDPRAGLWPSLVAEIEAKLKESKD